MFRTLVVILTASCATSVSAFVTAPIPHTCPTSSNLVLYGYVPDGLTKEQYEKIKKKEREAQKNLGRVGVRGFKSRSFQSFQEALERGEATHLMPVFNAKEKIAKGEIKKEDIPYMQRGGAWDNSDVKGARKVKWLQSDKDYANGGYRKEQSVSILGTGAGLDWTGTKSRSGPESARNKPVKTGREYQRTNMKDMNGNKKKGPFGLW